MARRNEFDLATERARRRQARVPSAIRAHYDRTNSRIIVGLNTDLDISFSPQLVEGLKNAKPPQLERIEITPSGFGLHFPKLDADIYLPALLQGIFGSRRWMAAQLGAAGGQSATPAKAKAARKNGRLGGRPRKTPIGSTIPS